MKLSLLFAALTLSATLSAQLAQAQAQAPARPATVKTKTKPAGQPRAKAKATASSKSSAAVAAAHPAATTGAEAPTPPLDADRIAARANALTDNMREGLALTPAQTEKVRVINTTGVRNVEQARLRYRTDPRKLQAYIDDVGSSRLSALKDVLTPAQFAKYQRKREEKMGVPSAPANSGTPAPGLPGGGVD